MWHCPSCGALQEETARCWVCRRSSTTCSTCRHFRTSLSAEVGWCALDPKRRPLTGLEQRGCWQERPAAAEPPTAQVGIRTGRRQPGIAADPDGEGWAAPSLDFIPVELVGRIGAPAEPAVEPAVERAVEPALPLIALEAHEDWSERTSLFGDLEA
jgi:hypothetical protein